MQFQSERLTFREFREEDFPLFYSVFSNEQVMRYAWIDRFDNEEAARPYFRKILQNNLTFINREAFEFAVFSAENNVFIGFAAIEINCQNSWGGCGEIGYFLLPAFWGQGFGTEIANTLIRISFEQLKLHRVTARCNANNLRSEKVMKKAGMRKEGEFRKVRFKNSQWDNEFHYSILCDEYPCAKLAPRFEKSPQYKKTLDEIRLSSGDK
jgi:ribosomal-protein-alanine N-acetyltransferase